MATTPLGALLRDLELLLATVLSKPRTPRPSFFVPASTLLPIDAGGSRSVSERRARPSRTLH